MGCSRDGKGPLVADTLEPLVALAIPQESGSDGSACWRLSNYQNSQGQNMQTTQQIITENVWFSKAFDSNINNFNTLPLDHHSLAGLVAPRGLLVIEISSQECLGALSTYGCMFAARKQWEALGVPNNMGYSQVGGHSHCSFPSSQSVELNASVGKFLLGQSGAKMNVFKTDGNFNYNLAQWDGVDSANACLVEDLNRKVK